MARHSEPQNVDLATLNDSELVALCQWLGIKTASRAWPRWLLLRAIERYECYEIDTPIEQKRQRLSTFLKRWWDRLIMQSKKKVCPNCEFCRDLQVLECYDDNQVNIEGQKK